MHRFLLRLLILLTASELKMARAVHDGLYSSPSLEVAGVRTLLDDADRPTTLATALQWKRLGNDIWIPLSNVTGDDDDEDHLPAPTWDRDGVFDFRRASPSLSLARNHQRLLVLALGVARIYELRDANRPVRHWYPVEKSPAALLSKEGDSFPTERSADAAAGSTPRVTAAAISPNGLLLARHVVVVSAAAPNADRDARYTDEVSHNGDDDGSLDGRNSGSDADSGPGWRYTSTVQVVTIADEVVLGSWTESYHSASSTPTSSMACLSETRLVMEDRFLLVLCPTWDGRRGRAALYRVLPRTQLVWEWKGVDAGDGLGTAGDVDATSRDGVVRVALSSPGYGQGMGLVRLYDLVAVVPQGLHESVPSSWTARQVAKDLTGIAPGDRFGTSVSLSHTGEGTVAIGSSKGVIYVVSFERPPQPTPVSFATVVQEIDIPEKYLPNSRTQDPETKFGSYPFSDVAVYVTPDAQRLVVAFESTGSEFVRKTKHVIVYEFSDNADSPMRWIQVAHFRLGSNALVTTTGYTLAVWSVNQGLAKTDTGSRWGRARVILDRSPFCSADASCHVDPFLERRSCRSGRSAATDEAACRALAPLHNATCTWVNDTRVFGVIYPSAAPAAIQREDPDHMTLLTACVCDRGLACTGAPAATDRDLRVCVLGIPSQIKLKRVTSMYLQQDRIRYSVLGIDGVRVEGVTSQCSDSVCHVLVPQWKFDLLTKGESSLLAAGTIALTPLAPSKVRKTLATDMGRGSRSTKDVAAHQGYFSAVIRLDTQRIEQKTPQSVQVPYVLWIVLAFLLVVAMLCCFCTMRKFFVPSGEGGEQATLVTQ